ncbi:MAG TPA: DUF3551 domain-containing protein [Xanthobacteraceae bacterium]
MFYPWLVHSRGGGTFGLGANWCSEKAMNQRRKAMFRTLTAATLLAAAVGSSNAFAQGDYVHHNYCLKTSSAMECAFDSMAQCEAAKRGNDDICQPNTPPENH